MQYAFEIFQIIVTAGIVVGIVGGIVGGMIFGCPPAGVPFKGYYSKPSENRVRAWIGVK